MKSDHVQGHSLFAQVHIVPYIYLLNLCKSSWICLSQSHSMVLSGYNLFQSNQLSPPSASHVDGKLVVLCWMAVHCCHSAPDELQPQQLYFATLGGSILQFWPGALPYLLPVTCCITFPFSWPFKLSLLISSKTSQPTNAGSFVNCQTVSMVSSSRKSLKHQQPLCPSAAVQLKAISNCSFPKEWIAASSPETQAPIIASSCWK